MFLILSDDVFDIGIDNILIKRVVCNKREKRMYLPTFRKTRNHTYHRYLCDPSFRLFTFKHIIHYNQENCALPVFPDAVTCCETIETFAKPSAQFHAQYTPERDCNKLQRQS